MAQGWRRERRPWVPENTEGSIEQWAGHPLVLFDRFRCVSEVVIIVTNVFSFVSRPELNLSES